MRLGYTLSETDEVPGSSWPNLKSGSSGYGLRPGGPLSSTGRASRCSFVCLMPGTTGHRYGVTAGTSQRGTPPGSGGGRRGPRFDRLVDQALERHGQVYFVQFYKELTWEHDRDPIQSKPSSFVEALQPTNVVGRCKATQAGPRTTTSARTINRYSPTISRMLLVASGRLPRIVSSLTGITVTPLGLVLSALTIGSIG